MTKISSTELEQKVQRIHAVIEESGAEVQWNDHIPDPDNPTQLRQIDVSIRRDGVLIAVECRLHSRPQDVQWIEELIGRRTSLSAAGMIAVSSSGFTSGAIKKAAAHVIALRDFRSLAEDEVRSWGAAKTAWVHSIEFLRIRIRFGIAGRARVLSDDVMKELVRATLVPVILNKAVEIASELEGTDLGSGPRRTVTMNAVLDLSGPVAQAAGVCRAVVDATIVPHRQRLPLVSLAAYGHPEVPQSDRGVQVGDFGDGLCEITQVGDRVGLTINLSTVPMQPNSFAYGASVDLGRNFVITPHVVGARLPVLQADLIRTELVVLDDLDAGEAT
jgi:hypothetical protein